MVDGTGQIPGVDPEVEPAPWTITWQTNGLSDNVSFCQHPLDLHARTSRNQGCMPSSEYLRGPSGILCISGLAKIRTVSDLGQKGGLPEIT